MTTLVSNDEPVRTIIINRPDCRNAVDPETAATLRTAFLDFEADESAQVAILAGAGGNFCAGFDLKSVGSGKDRYEPEGAGPMGPTRMLLTKPVIAAVEGYAVAGGLELALWCDLRVASETAIFGVFCRRWGVPLIDGGTVRLPRIVGQGRALDMILTGRPVAADEALSIGLANRIVPAGEAVVAAQTLAAEIAHFPALCMKTDRMSAYRQWDCELAEALRYEGREGAKPLRAEAVKGAKRFAEGEGRGGAF
ncbi:crotonase/enoyl-CoA hydratase family protein [Sphingorhabdus sp.]|jgi:enoyl-CoA hydratase|uniref:crotonase/enoyl-CoA hydratase family protein n=1 Tax=Sphingorhabdus sp. TaxID=1902408 RepID=UPI003BB1A04D|nr:crotonase/enoyl-CoA hydratase family protein [Sphingomonadales bacterium]MBL0023265.1 crotonase/enoyl-CoA hydratase family protein [Sphingomonadales bacterium]